MTKTRTTIQSETTGVSNDDSPSIVAFRVGLLEGRFDKFDRKLDALGGNFVTVETLREMKLVADDEHQKFHERLTSLETKTTSYPLIEKIVFTGVGLVLLTILGAGLSLVILK